MPRRWLIALVLVFTGVPLAALKAQEAVQAEREARKTYPDFALQVPPVNTSA